MAQCDRSNITELTRDWPLASHLEMSCLPDSVPTARLWARVILQEWGLGQLSDDVCLAVSEIVTNACVHATGLVRLWITSDRERVAVIVGDASPESPVRTELDTDAPNGRGLMILDAICERWGSYQTYGGGKLVWAMLAQPSRRLEEDR